MCIASVEKKKFLEKILEIMDRKPPPNQSIPPIDMTFNLEKILSSKSIIVQENPSEDYEYYVIPRDTSFESYQTFNIN